MTLETLKTSRIIVPGIIVLLIAMGFVVNPSDPGGIAASLTIFNGILYSIIVVTIGGLYHLTDIRWRVLAPSRERIDRNIKLRLIAPFENDPKIANAKGALLSGRKLLDLFYYFIDRDESLKQRSKEVYFNGLFWSSLADISFLCGLGAVAYMVAFLYSRQLYYTSVAALLAFTAVLAVRFLAPVEKRHTEFGNAQIDYIILHYKSDLQKKLMEAIQV
jgi:Flp pilus assembly protein TadB